jgi:uncharacterized protein
MRYIITLLVSSLFFSFSTFAQSTATVSMDLANQFDMGQTRYQREKGVGMLGTVSQSMFIFYKKFVSSQDYSSCVFIPSCSEHGLQAVQKNGLIKGMIATMDRLSRCSPLSAEYYEVDKNTGLLIDPVK